MNSLKDNVSDNENAEANGAAQVKDASDVVDAMAVQNDSSDEYYMHGEGTEVPPNHAVDLSVTDRAEAAPKSAGAVLQESFDINRAVKTLPSGDTAQAAEPLLAGEVMKSFQLSNRKRDIVVEADEVFKQLDEQSASRHNEGGSTSEDTSRSFQHYFLKVSDRSKGIMSDQVDANPGSTGSSNTTAEHAGGTAGVTTTQAKGIKQNASLEKEFRYEMNKPERGCFVIFNQTFDLKRLPKRDGTRKDAENLEKMARKLGFEYVHTITDATKMDITNILLKLGKASHDKYDCFACAILTHGGDGDILSARDEEMKLTDFTRPFGADMCPSLAGKPKLFFIQACRGVKVDSGGLVKLTSFVQSDTVDSRPMADGVGGDGDTVKYVTIPAAADFLIANSTCPDHYSFRNTELGSLFVQNLCNAFDAYGDSMELMQIMTRVNRMMAYDFTSNVPGNPQWDKKKQIPSIATRLTAEVYFPPKRTILPESDVRDIPSTSVKVTQPETRTGVESSARREASTSTLTTSTPQRPANKFFLSPEPNYPATFAEDDDPPIRRTYSESRSSRHPIHKSTTEPVSIEHLKQNSGFVEHRRSFPLDTTRIVVNPTKLTVAGRKVNKSYEETDV